MKPDVVVFYDPTRSTWVMVSRPAYLEYVLNTDQYKYIRSIYVLNQRPNSGLTNILKTLGVDIDNLPARKIFILRPKGKTSIFKASWAVNNDCPYQCKICVMRGITEQLMPKKYKLKTAHRLVKFGCIWLQLTGWEPTGSPDFCDLYETSYDLGFLIKIQTNGFYISQNKQLQQLLKEKPPCQITLSLYGATAKTYDSYTSINGSHDYFQASLKILKSFGINTHINIIITRDNEHEQTEMIELCKQSGFSWFISGRLTPTFSGSPIPLHYSVVCPDAVQSLNQPMTQTLKSSCQAGKHFIHVTSSGHVLPCPTSRIICKPFNIFLNILIFKLKLKKLVAHINKVPTQCTNCSCEVCPPLRILFFLAKSKHRTCTMEANQ